MNINKETLYYCLIASLIFFAAGLILITYFSFPFFSHVSSSTSTAKTIAPHSIISTFQTHKVTNTNPSKTQLPTSENITLAVSTYFTFVSLSTPFITTKITTSYFTKLSSILCISTPNIEPPPPANNPANPPANPPANNPANPPANNPANPPAADPANPPAAAPAATNVHPQSITLPAATAAPPASISLPTTPSLTPPTPLPSTAPSPTSESTAGAGINTIATGDNLNMTLNILHFSYVIDVNTFKKLGLIRFEPSFNANIPLINKDWLAYLILIMSDLKSEQNEDNSFNFNGSNGQEFLNKPEPSEVGSNPEEPQQSSGGPIRRKNNAKSPMDEFFERTKESQTCKICKKMYAGIGETSTGTLKTHLRRNHQSEFERGAQQTDFERKTRTTLNFRRVTPFQNRRERLHHDLENIKSRISLTGDLWTLDNNQCAFFGVTLHYIDDDWIFKRFLLDIIPFRDSHSGANIVQSLSSLLTELDLSSKILALTTNNALPTIVFGHEMELEMNKGFNNLGFSHYRCGSHVLNIAVQYGLQVHNNSIEKVRKFINKVRSSNLLMEDLRRIFEDQSIPFTIPQTDVESQWRSTYLMIEKVKQIQIQVNLLVLQHQDEFIDSYPDEDDWLNINELLTVLSPFYSATLTLSSSVYPTTGDFQLTLWILRQHLQHEISVNATRYIVADSILRTLDEYWSIIDETSKIASVLDPRTKCSIFQQGSETDNVINSIRARMASYTPPLDIPENSNSIITSTSDPTLLSSYHSPTTFNRLDARAHLRSLTNQFLPTTQPITSNELEQYLSLPNGEDCEPLLWWKAHKKKFPLNLEIARPLLCLHSWIVEKIGENGGTDDQAGSDDDSNLKVEVKTDNSEK
ncbi:3301_t:CDS:2 [Cetraspora pellucida]|uniref:3301_t:CDS:1 n=2 Tax=Cetraspora pellucida TaxID=1433469 RepID=A0A9N8YVL5_9GLOM|nr:3301_t:CDS:2 [Cetraspora pellucida]